MINSSVMPQYQQVATTLRRRIANGEYLEGDIIPPSSELENFFSVSNITIRKALALLSNEGWVRSRRGVGTIVTRAPSGQPLKIAVSGNFTEWVDSASGKSLPIKQTVLECALKPAPSRVSNILECALGDALWTMQRIRRIAGNIISYHVNFGRPEVLGTIKKSTMVPNRNFVDVLRGECGVNLMRMDQTVEAMAADRDLAALLEVEFGTPLFFVENIYLDGADTVVAVSHLYLRGDHYAYQTSISLEDDAHAR